MVDLDGTSSNAEQVASEPVETDRTLVRFVHCIQKAISELEKSQKAADKFKRDVDDKMPLARPDMLDSCSLTPPPSERSRNGALEQEPKDIADLMGFGVGVGYDSDSTGDVGFCRALAGTAHSPVSEDEEKFARKVSFVEQAQSKSWTAGVVESDAFMSVTMSAIVLNAVYIGINAEHNDSQFLYDAKWPFVVIENIFCVIFVVELVMRWLACNKWREALTDVWFCFDLVLVFLMVLETWILEPLFKATDMSSVDSFPVEHLRLLRLLRLSRLTRLVRRVPELATMSKGIVRGVRACAASVGMLLVLIYMYAVALHSLLKNAHEFNAEISAELWGIKFDKLTNSMWILLVNGTFMLDGTNTILSKLLYSSSEFSHHFACFLIVSFLFLSAMVICNMLVGVLCEVVSSVAASERDANARELLKESIYFHLEKFDDGDGMISKAELGNVMSTPRSKVVLDRLNVDRAFLLAQGQMLFKHAETQIPIHSIMELMLSCRGDSPATVHTVGTSLSYMTETLNVTLTRLETHLVSLIDLKSKRKAPLDRHDEARDRHGKAD